MLKGTFVAAAILMAGPLAVTPVQAQSAPGTAQVITGQGKVNSLDAQAKKINLTHGPIAAIKWPAMTMDFVVLPNVDLSRVKIGDTVTFTLGRAPDGMYAIDGIK